MAAETVRDVIRIGLRKTGTLSAGEEPTTADATDALDSLQSLYLEAVHSGRFGRLTPVIATEDYEAAENEMVTSGGYTITLPTTIEDADTGEDRPPRDLSVIIVATAGEEPEISIYDAYRAEWVALNGLELSDTAPLISRGAEGLGAALAMRLAEDYGQSVTPGVASQAASFLSALANKRSALATAPVYY